MKKLLFITAFCFLFALSCSAKSGDINGSIYSTDILATVNGTPVESFNIGGKTAIVLEDLQKLGANVTYEDSLRTLLVDFTSKNDISAEIARGTTGKILGNVYESDIKTYCNGTLIHTFSLNGKMAAAIEEIGADNTYSNCNAKFVWNGSTRTISLDFLVDNFAKAYAILVQKNLTQLTVHNDTIQLAINHFYGGAGMSSSYDATFDTNRIYPIYANGEQVGIHFPLHIKNFFQDDTGAVSLIDGFTLDFICYDLQKITEICANTEETKPTYQEVLDYYVSQSYAIDASDRVDTAAYTFFISTYQSGKQSTGYHILRILKNGEYHDYAQELNDLGLSPALNDHTYKIDSATQTVTFNSNDKTVILDLKTGVMK